MELGFEGLGRNNASFAGAESPAPSPAPVPAPVPAHDPASLGFDALYPPTDGQTDRTDADRHLLESDDVAARQRYESIAPRRISTPEMEGQEFRGVVERDRERGASLYFEDGIRRIDFILAYEVKTGADYDEAEVKAQQRRSTFECSLKEEFGLELETVAPATTSTTKTTFVKVHAPWDVLCLRAEMSRLKMPIRADDEDDDDENFFGRISTSLWTKMTQPFRVDSTVVSEPPDFYTCAFNRSKMEIFRIENKETFFSSAQRSRLTYDILARAPYEEERRERKIGIDPLLSKNVYSAAYPLHDGEPYEKDETILTLQHKSLSKSNLVAETENCYGSIPDRQRLYNQWGRFSQFYKQQPLHLIRFYFGEKIAIYFSWLGFYTAFLVPVALAGIIATIYGATTMHDNYPTQDICNVSVDGNLVMCPQCREAYCNFWPLVNSCLYSKITYLVDNEITVVFAFGMAMWSILFLEFWKRRQATLAFDWDLIDDFDESSPVRPEFEAKCDRRKKNPITGLVEPYFPKWARFPRYFTGLTVVLVAIFCVLIAITGVIFYRVSMRAVFWKWRREVWSVINDNSKVVITVTSATINLIFIMILGRLYGFVAVKLTELENQRTDKDFEDSYTLKMFCFQFVNYYSSIFYIAFFKGRFFKFFDNSESLQKDSPARYDECDPAGCLIELFIQMFIIMVGKQILSNVQEFLIPKMWSLYRKKTDRVVDSDDEEKLKKHRERPQWENDYHLTCIGTLGLFNEYLEMVIQFGFVTLFVTAFPLAPVFALINNIIEIRLDANKFTCSLRRQRPMQAKDIGVWFYILSTVARLAVITNALVIAFTSNFIERIFYLLTESRDGTLQGFTRFTLSRFNVSDFSSETRPAGNFTPPEGVCFYRDYRSGSDQDYSRTATWYNVMLAKVVFVLLFEHIVYFLRDVIAWFVPDVPAEVLVSIRREAFLGRKALYDQELEDNRALRREKSKDE